VLCLFFISRYLNNNALRSRGSYQSLDLYRSHSPRAFVSPCLFPTSSASASVRPTSHQNQDRTMSGFPNPNQSHFNQHGLPSPTSPPSYGSPPPSYGNHGSTPLAHPPPTPSAPFLGPIELPYSPTPPASARQLPYAPLLVTLGSPTSSVGSSRHSHSHSNSVSSVGSVGSAGSGSGHSHGSAFSVSVSPTSSTSAAGSSARHDYSRRTSSSRQRDVAPQPMTPLNTNAGASSRKRPSLNILTHAR
jgi:hypothetical protein